MLAFVTSLPHPANCASYRARSQLLVTTLASVLRQRDRDIHVVVVANQPPECDLPTDPRLEVALVPFPPTESPAGRPSPVGIVDDKGAKLAVGTSYAVRRDARHVMWVDSDDFVHRDIAGVVAAAPDASGWYFDSGYVHIRGDRRVTTVDHGFHQHNGSSHVVRLDLVDLPAQLDPELSRDEVLDTVGRRKAAQTMGRHRPVVEFFSAMGAPLEPFPFPATIWELGTGENCSRTLATSGEKRPIAGRIADDFGLPAPSRMTAARSAALLLSARVSRRVPRRPA